MNAHLASWLWLIFQSFAVFSSADRVNGTGTINGILTGLRKVLIPNRPDQSKASPTTIQIFVAGFGRTGTSSLTLALEMLGFNPLHSGDVSQVIVEVNDLYNNKITTNQLFSSIASKGFNVTGLDVLNHL